MAFQLDPVDFYRRMSSARAKEAGDFSDAFGKFESGMARGYAQDSKQGGGLTSMLGAMDTGMNDSAGTNTLMGDLAANQAMEMDLGMAALNAKTDMEVAEIQEEIAEQNRKEAEKQAGKNRSAGTRNAIIGAVGGIGAAAIGAAI